MHQIRSRDLVGLMLVPVDSALSPSHLSHICHATLQAREKPTSIGTSPSLRLCSQAIPCDLSSETRSLGSSSRLRGPLGSVVSC